MLSAKPCPMHKIVQWPLAFFAKDALEHCISDLVTLNHLFTSTKYTATCSIDAATSCGQPVHSTSQTALAITVAMTIIETSAVWCTVASMHKDCVPLCPCLRHTSAVCVLPR